MAFYFSKIARYVPLALPVVLALSCEKKTTMLAAEASIFKIPSRTKLYAQDLGECEHQVSEVLNQFMANYASRHNTCREAEDCVEYRDVPIHINAIDQLVACENVWKLHGPNCQTAIKNQGSVVEAVKYVQQKPTRYNRPGRFECFNNRCVAVSAAGGKHSLEPAVWKLRYEPAMVKAQDPALPHKSDPKCAESLKELAARVRIN